MRRTLLNMIGSIIAMNVYQLMKLLQFGRLMEKTKIMCLDIVKMK